LGCSGYSDFKQSLVYSLALRKQIKVSSLDDFKAEDSAKDIIEKVTTRNIQALELCIKALKVESLEKCVQLMHKAKSIDLFGVGASFVVAKDFYQKLIRVAKPVNLDGDWQVQLTYARNMAKDDLAIAVSYSGLTKETAQCAKVAHERGAKVIAITKNDGRTRLAHTSDVILGVPETEAYLRAGAMTSRMAQLNIVDILYMSYVHDDLEEYSQLFMHNYIGKDEG
jgi:DNA-binding MurR/RpiR family transcriptional regulator